MFSWWFHTATPTLARGSRFSSLKATGAWIEGTKSLRTGMPVAILEDVVTTGGSALKAIARVREHGLKVAIILGIVDREEGGREVLEKEAPLVTLFRRSDFL